MYINYKELKNKNIEYINKIPKIVHRTLLFDSSIPKEFLNYFYKFDKNSTDFIKVLWSEKDLYEIMNSANKKVYESYKYNIQKADYARYIIIKKFGGVYADFDILLKKNLSELIENNYNDMLLFEEKTLTEEECINNLKNQQIRFTLSEKYRLECPLRIANYFIIAKPEHILFNPILHMCYTRSLLNIRNQYDILFTTGTDVTSAVVEKLLSRLKNFSVIYRKDSDEYFEHLRGRDYHNNGKHRRD